MSECFIYFIKPVGAAGPIKIGLSWSPERRLGSLMSWSPVDLEVITTIPGDVDLETNIHDCFFNDRFRGEWFRPTKRVLAAVDAIKNGVPVHEAIDLRKREGDTKASRYLKAAATRRASNLVAAAIRAGAIA